MRLGMESYPEYRASGVPWLDDIPTHWDGVLGGAVLQQKHVSNRGMVERTVLSLSRGQIVVKPPEKLHGLVPTSFETYQIVDPGDIIVRPTDLQNDWNTIRVGIARDRGIITSAYLCFRSRPPLSSEYAHVLLLGYDLKKVFYGMGSGLRQNLDWSDFKRLPVLLPPPDEQDAIVAYVNQLDRRVRRFIRNRQRLIEVLNEEKQAIITQAVTRGLDLNVRLKPSGVEWLGEIPEHWQVIKLKRLGQIRYGLGQPPKESIGGFPLIRATNVKSGRIIAKGLVYVDPRDIPQARNAILRTNEIIVVRSGALTADSAIIPEEYDGAVAGYDMVISVGNAYPQFIAMALLSQYVLDSQLYLLKARAAQPHLNAEELGSALIVLPPESEQRLIAEHIRAQTSDVENLIARADREIDLIREYRTRLIADVVTGKVDVRRLAPAAGDADGEEELDETEETLDVEMLSVDREELGQEAGGE